MGTGLSAGHIIGCYGRFRVSIRHADAVMPTIWPAET